MPSGAVKGWPVGSIDRCVSALVAAEPWGSNVLLVEDNPGDARLVTRMLRRTSGDFHVHHVRRLDEAVGVLRCQEFSVVLLDLSLPDGLGSDAVKEVSGAAPGAPIVVLTGFQADDAAIEAIQAGAQDFLTKGGIDSSALIRSMRFAIERKRSETRLAYLAHHDPLTGLVNRACFNDRLDRALARAGRTAERVAVLYLDLDRFKAINDTLGHDMGDRLLIEVAARLRRSVRVFETVARLGGDEFVILLEGLSGPEPVEAVAKRVLSHMAAPVRLDGRPHRVSTSIGAALSQPGDRRDALLGRADEAMYRAKRSGRGTYALWSRLEESTAPIAAADVEEGLQTGAIHLVYQPRMDLGSLRVTGAEALIRWRDPQRGLLEPQQILPALAEAGLEARVGRWVVRQACRQGRRWASAGAGFRISVNLCATQLLDEGLVGTVAEALEAAELSGRSLELDIREEALALDAPRAAAVLGELRGLGVRVALDDFGPASSLEALARFALDSIKLDRSLVTRAVGSPEDADRAGQLITRARREGIEVVAEGVETPAEQAILRRLGCDAIQGRHLCGPMEPAGLTVWLAAREADG